METTDNYGYHNNRPQSFTLSEKDLVEIQLRAFGDDRNPKNRCQYTREGMNCLNYGTISPDTGGGEGQRFYCIKHYLKIFRGVSDNSKPISNETMKARIDKAINDILTKSVSTLEKENPIVEEVLIEDNCPF